jgi:hypothetical protein
MARVDLRIRTDVVILVVLPYVIAITVNIANRKAFHVRIILLAPNLLLYL